MIILHELSLLQSVQTEQAEAVPAGD
jgi:hypothetical protein